ncbi:MAG TPA: aminopeptidase P family protein [Firmicutes bacterium]|nr:aminopeptidase P family protein [Candidatus Fermentithermobacillaceae bacterium]
MSSLSSRLEAIRAKMGDEQVDGFLVTSMTNWRYVSGFTGDAGCLLVTHDKAFLLTDSRYVEQAEKQCPGFSVKKTTHDEDVLKDVVRKEGVKRLAFEKRHTSYEEWEKLRDRLSDVELKGITGWVENLRMVKTPEEIELIARAQEIADDAFALLFQSIRKGAREEDLALELEFTMRKMGAESVSFPIIVVSGERSSLPHGTPTGKTLADGDFVTFDFGATYQGYHSDETRTFVIGHLDKKHEEVYGIVLEAQEAALRAVKPGVLARDVDLAGRKVIEDAGYGEYFGHGIGHGVGLEIHEGPSVSVKSETVLEPGMVITIEPGIYIPGFGGVRVEELVVVTDDGMRVLTQSPKELTVIKA